MSLGESIAKLLWTSFIALALDLKAPNVEVVKQALYCQTPMALL